MNAREEEYQPHPDCLHCMATPADLARCGASECGWWEGARRGYSDAHGGAKYIYHAGQGFVEVDR